MRIADVKPEMEVGYADVFVPVKYRPLHCRVVEITGSPRRALVEVVDGIPDTRYATRSRLTVHARYLRPWTESQAIAAARREKEQRQRVVLERLQAALTTLGLHLERGVSIADNLDGEPDVMTSYCRVSAAELEKLATRAMHLVELERSVYDWYCKDDGGPAPFNISTVIEWARAHDFSMMLSLEVMPNDNH